MERVTIFDLLNSLQLDTSTTLLVLSQLSSLTTLQLDKLESSFFIHKKKFTFISLKVPSSDIKVTM